MNKKHLALISLIFFVCLIVFSCRRDIENLISDQVVTSQSLENARIWHAQHAKDHKNALKPIWADSWTIKSSSGELLVVPAPEHEVNSKDISIRRLFIFTLSGNRVSSGVIMEFLGEKYDVNKHLNELAANAQRESIDGFNGKIFMYDINYQYTGSAVFEEGIKLDARSRLTSIGRKTLPELKAIANHDRDLYGKRKLAVALDFGRLATTTGSGQTCTTFRVTTEYYTNGVLTSVVITYETECVPNPPTENSSGNSSSNSSGSSSSSNNYQNPDYGGTPVTGGGGGTSGTGGNSGETLNLNLIDTAGLSLYPALKSLITNLPSLLASYPNIKQALAHYTGFTEAQITALMKPGVGPKIQVVDLPPKGGLTTMADFDRATKTLRLHAPLVNGLDAVNSPTRYKALVMLMTITTLHEIVHYGRDANNLSRLVFINGVGYEAGYTFEMNIQPPGVDGRGIDRNNAIEWIKYYEYNSNPNN